MKKAIILLSLLGLIGCSEQKKIAKAVKKHGAKQITAYIAVNYPEYLRADTVTIKDTITKEIQITVKEIIHDTIIGENINHGCDYFNYSDRNIELQITSGRIRYKVKERAIKETVKVPYEVKVPCPPCPTMAVIDEVKKQTKHGWWEQTYRFWFWFSMGLIAIWVISKVKKQPF